MWSPILRVNSVSVSNQKSIFAAVGVFGRVSTSPVGVFGRAAPSFENLSYHCRRAESQGKKKTNVVGLHVGTSCSSYAIACLLPLWVYILCKGRLTTSKIATEPFKKHSEQRSHLEDKSCLRFRTTVKGGVHASGPTAVCMYTNASGRSL